MPAPRHALQFHRLDPATAIANRPERLCQRQRYSFSLEFFDLAEGTRGAQEAAVAGRRGPPSATPAVTCQQQCWRPPWRSAQVPPSPRAAAAAGQMFFVADFLRAASCAFSTTAQRGIRVSEFRRAPRTFLASAFLGWFHCPAYNLPCGKVVSPRYSAPCLRLSIMRAAAAAAAVLAAALLHGVAAQLSPTSTPGAVGCVARYLRIENTPGVANMNFYVRAFPTLSWPDAALAALPRPRSPWPAFPRPAQEVYAYNAALLNVLLGKPTACLSVRGGGGGGARAHASVFATRSHRLRLAPPVRHPLLPRRPGRLAMGPTRPSTTLHPRRRTTTLAGQAPASFGGWTSARQPCSRRWYLPTATRW